MIPIVLVTSDEKKINSFVRNFISEHKVDANYVFPISPQGKEFSIEQIRELKKNIIYNFSQLHLYILYDFDSSSFEAQNAFLKTLEEHQQTIQFILVVKNPHRLAPTILSRSKIINLTAKDESGVEDEGVIQSLKKFIDNGDLKIMADPRFQVKGAEGYDELFKKITFFFRQRLAADPKSAVVLKELLSAKSVVEGNNVDPQSSLDHLLLFIKRLYDN